MSGRIIARATCAVLSLAIGFSLGCPAGFAQSAPTVTPEAPAEEGKPLGIIELRASVLKTDNYPVDLASVLQLVEDQNLIIAQSEKNTDVLQSRYRQRQAALLPSIDASYAQNWQEGQQRFISGGGGGFVGTGGSGGSRSSGDRQVQTFVQPQIGASWTLYPGGRNIYEMLAAKRRKEAADSLLKETYQEQLARAAEEYYRLLAAYMQKNVASMGAQLALEQVKLNEAKVAVGNGIPLDLSRARTTYAQRQTSVIQAENGIIQAEQNLLNRLNLDPTIHLVPNELEAFRKPLIPATLSIDHMIAQAVQNNPAVTTAAEELKALGYDYKAVRSDLIPSVTLRAFTRGSGSEINDLQRSNSGGLTFNVNLLENMGLQVPLRMRERKQLIEQKVLEQKQLVRNVESQVMTAYLASENFTSALESARQEVASAEESYELAVGRFRAGYGINIDVLDAEVALTTARSNLAQAMLDYNQAQVQLVEALGQTTPDTLTQGIIMQGTGDHVQNP